MKYLFALVSKGMNQTMPLHCKEHFMKKYFKFTQYETFFPYRLKLKSLVYLLYKKRFVKSLNWQHKTKEEQQY